jgi:hypothetical protein
VLENTNLATGTREHGELTVPGGDFPNRFHSPLESPSLLCRPRFSVLSLPAFGGAGSSYSSSS